MALDKSEIEEIVKKVVAEMADEGKKLKPTPRCEIKWKDDALVLECQSKTDRDRAKEILEKGDVIIKVKPKDEEDTKGEE